MVEGVKEIGLCMFVVRMEESSGEGKKSGDPCRHVDS